jgi:hypothetical protein
MKKMEKYSSMEYNTSRPKMLIPEYGRNVQKMIDFAIELSTKEERNKAARAIIEVMGQLNPHLRDVEDYRHKLWTHFFIMSDFKIDVDSPYPRPKQEEIDMKPDFLKYPKNKIRYGHYGHNVQKMISNIVNIENDEEREIVTNRLANLMKKLYVSYNNEAVENEVILEQLVELSEGKLQMANPNELTATHQILRSIGGAPSNQIKKKKPLKSKFKKKR